MVPADTASDKVNNKTCRSACLSQYVTPLSLFHDDQAGVDVVVVLAPQLDPAVIDCGAEEQNRHPQRSLGRGRGRPPVGSPTRAHVPVPVPVPVLGIFRHFVRALMGLIPDFLQNKKTQEKHTDVNTHNFRGRESRSTHPHVPGVS